MATSSQSHGANLQSQEPVELRGDILEAEHDHDRTAEEGRGPRKPVFVEIYNGLCYGFCLWYVSYKIS